MKKLLLFFVMFSIASGSILEARRGYHGGHGYRHRGWGGYGYGPGVGFSLAVPVGGGGPRKPASVKQFKRVNGYYPNSIQQFCSWANGYFSSQAKANRECNLFKNYTNATASGYSSRPAGYVSFGVGGGRGGYYGGPWRRGWW